MDKPTSNLLNNINEDAHKFKSLPFWSWNDKLEEKELISQIEKMNESQIGGFFMHARGGLVTEYMGDEWFDMTKACIEKAKELGMQAWAYDESGWPSGFAAGLVPAMGIQYQQKTLEMISIDCDLIIPANTLGLYTFDTNNNLIKTENPKTGDYAVVCNINKYYIDALNSESITKFIEVTHEKYYQHFGDEFGKALGGFFTDEPQYANGQIPWSQNMKEIFSEKYHYEITDKLALLFIKGNGYEKVRYDYYSLVSELFVNGFIKQIYDWCTAHNCKLTGHVMNEDSLISQMISTGGVMSCYEYFHIPGIDWLCRQISNPIIPKQLGSACEQLGKKQVISETFALCGWDVSFNELKWIAQWQFLNGINTICQHLEGYTLRGFRKRDYPPSLFIQQPWFSEYSYFNEYLMKLGSALTQGSDQTRVLLLHPIKSAYITHSNNNDDTIKYNDDFINATSRLSNLHIEHHYGDEVLMAKHGSVVDGNLCIGKCSYNKIVLPSMLTITKETLNLLQQFINANGEIYSLGELPIFVDAQYNDDLKNLLKNVKPIKEENKIIQSLANKEYLYITSDGKICNDVQYKLRKLEDNSLLYYVVNLNKTQRFDCTLVFEDDKIVSFIDFTNDTTKTCETDYQNNQTNINLSFEPIQSYLLQVTNGVCHEKHECEQAENITLNDEFVIESQTDNALTLDKCEYRIDNGEWQNKHAIILIQRDLVKMKKPCDVDLKFKFQVENVGDLKKLHFAMECPQEFSIFLNGTKLEYIDAGYYVDKSFRRLDIKGFTKSGENELILSRHFYQNDNVYHVLFDHGVHEVERNRLTFDVELESIYLVGDFSVVNSDPYTLGDNRSMFITDNFSISKQKNKVLIKEITHQGYWFFSGNMLLSQNIIINKKGNTKYKVRFSKINAPVVNLFVNNNFVKTMAFTPFDADISDFIENGENKISIQIFSGNRNLLGPHHFPHGECYSVAPHTFTDHLGWSNDGNGVPIWNDGYSFVTFGIES